MSQPRRIVPDGGVRAGLNTSGATISANRIVKRHTLTDAVTPTTAATDRPYGVTMSAVDANVTVDVQVEGKALVEAGAAVTKGAQVTSDAVGRGIATTTSANFYIGIAETAAAAAGDVIEVTLGIDRVP
jgi:hypothetical protein